MDQQMKMAKQMIDIQRASFDGMLNNIVMFWEQTESMMNSFLNQAVWMPEEGKKAFRDWADNNKKSCETFKRAVDEGYRNLEKYFNSK